MGCYITLHAWYETDIVKAVDILIKKMPVLGESIKAECDDLLKKAESLSSMVEQDSSVFQRKHEDLSLLARRIIPRFRGLTCIATLGKWQKIKAWVKNHPHIYGLTGGVILLIIFSILGLFKPQWRNWCWGTAGITFLVLILSLLGGKSHQ